MSEKSERLAIQLGLHMAAVAGTTVRELRYPQPSMEQWQRLSTRLKDEALAAAELLADDPSPVSRERLADAAEVSAVQAVREIFGPPPNAV